MRPSDKMRTFGVAEIKRSFLLFFAILLVGCGSGGGSEDENSAPTLTNAAAVSVEENLLRAIVLSATDVDGDTLTYGIQGGDSSSFAVDVQTGEVTFVEAPDYETKQSHTFTATASDGKETAALDVTITITDKYFIPMAKIEAEDAERFDDFGNSVAMDGDYIVVGANDEDNTSDEAGSAYVFKISLDGTVEQIAKLNADNTVIDVGFGDAVAIDGDYIVVGAAKEDGSVSEAGSVYLYKIEAGAIVNRVDKLFASDQGTGDRFGTSVSIDGDYLVIGAAQDDMTATDAGSAYLFKRTADTFVELARFQAADAGVFDLFGMSVAIDAGNIVVGAHAEDTTAQGAGSAYLFKIDTNDDVNETAKIQADDPEANDHFGSVVDIDAGHIVISAADKDTSATDAGSVYLFDIETDGSVSQLARLDADDAEENDRFGNALAISGDHIVIGARFEDSTAGGAGSTYLFKIDPDDNAPVLMEKSQAFDAALDDNFGAAVAISGDRIISAAIYDDTIATNTGSAYLYIKDQAD